MTLAEIRTLLGADVAWRGLDDIALGRSTIRGYYETRAAYVEERSRTLANVIEMCAALDAERTRTALDALKAVLPLVSDMARDDSTYGYYHGGDPRDFTPDAEVCTPEEIAAHKAACEAWDRGETPDPGGPHQALTEDDAVRIDMATGVAREVTPPVFGWKTVAHFGMGTTSTYDAEARALWETVCGAITALESEA